MQKCACYDESMPLVARPPTLPGDGVEKAAELLLKAHSLGDENLAHLVNDALVPARERRSA